MSLNYEKPEMAVIQIKTIKKSYLYFSAKKREIFSAWVDEGVLNLVGISSFPCRFCWQR